MEDNNDTIETLKIKNQEMLLNKKKIDLDTSMESLVVFYSNYCINLANEINNHVCLIKNTNPNSENGKIMNNTIISFFTMMSNKLRELVLDRVNKLKEKLNSLSDDEYSKELQYTSINICNQMLEYYGESIDMLIEELTSDISDNMKNRISNYLFENIYGKMMNVLKDKFMYSIKVIDNNYEENNQIIQDINKKTLK